MLCDISEGANKRPQRWSPVVHKRLFIPLCSVIFPSSSVACAWSPSQRPSPEPKGQRPSTDAPRSQRAIPNHAYNPHRGCASPHLPSFRLSLAPQVRRVHERQR
ncbi:hypothetical protein K438DRAFT_1843544 [Mycena galopus ATCC 62051]|nr:hypothetical protein K438DRAFT_1843544 [Mycena galopus ATCC 62051]